MSWVRIDDGFPDCNKAVFVGSLGVALHLAAICYSSRNLTDGYIAESKVPGLLPDVPRAKLRHLVSRMLMVAPNEENPLWLKVEGGYSLHHYLEYQPSRLQVLAKREADNARKKTRYSAQLPLEVASDSARIPEVHPLPSHPDPGSSSEEPPNDKTRGRVRTLTEADIADLIDQFPTVDVHDQAERYLDWLKTKPKGHHRDQLAGLRNWLKRSRDEAASKARGTPAESRNGRYADAGARAAARLGSRA